MSSLTTPEYPEMRKSWGATAAADAEADADAGDAVGDGERMEASPDWRRSCARCLGR